MIFRHAVPALVALLVPFAAQAAAPPLIPVTGFLTDTDGVPIDGTVDVEFNLYTAQASATPAWTDTLAVDVFDGQFTAYLGSVAALDLALFRDNTTLYLGVAVESATEMSPRFEIGSAPFAGHAKYCDDAATVGGIAPADIALTADGVDWSAVSNVPPTLLNGDQDTTYTGGAGLTLSVANEFSVDQTSIEGWARGVAYDSVAELRTDLDAIYAARQTCTLDQVLAADATGAWVCSDPAALPTITTLQTNVTNLLSSGRTRLELTRVIKGDLGATVAIGSISNNGIGETANLQIRTHCNNTIDNLNFNISQTTYTGATTNWLEVPVNQSSASYQGRGTFTVDVYRQAVGSTTDPLFVRVRNRGGNAPGEDCTLYVTMEYDSGVLPGALTPLTTQSTIATAFNATTAPAGGAVTGYYGNYEWNFPVSNGMGWGSSGGLGLVVRNNGNVGIGTSTPTQRLDVAGTVRATNFSGTLNGVKMYAGQQQFGSGTCNSVNAPCIVNLTPGAFASTPVCTISMNNSDATGYTEKMVIKQTTATQLQLWKGQFNVDAGTTMIVNFICVGP